MVIKVYTSGISGNKEVKKRQQRIMMILDSKNIEYEAVDITEPGKESEKQFMQDNAKAKDSKHPLPPQIFNEEDYCGDYDGFDLANENDELEKFLKMPLPSPAVIEPPPAVNGATPHSNEKDTDGISPVERNEEIINNMVPNTVDSEPTEEKAVHGFCYTPSLASRLAKALEKAYLRSKEEMEKKSDMNGEEPMDEDKLESEPAVNDDEGMGDGNEENGGAPEEEEEE